jgi:hypothetical protein
MATFLVSYRLISYKIDSHASNYTHLRHVPQTKMSMYPCPMHYAVSPQVYYYLTELEELLRRRSGRLTYTRDGNQVVPEKWMPPDAWLRIIVIVTMNSFEVPI